MWGLELLKTARQKITERTPSPRKLLSTVVSFLRVGSSGGQTLFGVAKLYQYLTRSQNPWDVGGIITASVFVFTNVWTSLFTKVPSINRKLRPKPKNGTSLTQSDSISRAQMLANIDTSAFGVKAKIAYGVLYTIGLISGGFASLNVFLGSIVLEEFIAQLLWYAGIISDPDIHNTEEKELITQMAALVLFAANYVSYLSYNFEELEQNARILCDAIDKGEFKTFLRDCKNSRSVHYTLLISFLGIASAPFTGYFSTINALEKVKIPYLHWVIPHGTTRIIISGISAGTNFTNYNFTSVPAMYAYFEEKRNRRNKDMIGHFEGKIGWEPFATGTTYTFGMVDSIGSGAGNAIGVASTSHDVIGIDPYNPVLVGFAALSGVSYGVLYFFFGVRRQYLIHLDDVHKMRGHVWIDESSNGDPMLTPRKPIIYIDSSKSNGHNNGDANGDVAIQIEEVRDEEEHLEESSNEVESAENAAFIIRRPERRNGYTHATSTAILYAPPSPQAGNSLLEEKVVERNDKGCFANCN